MVDLMEVVIEAADTKVPIFSYPPDSGTILFIQYTSPVRSTAKKLQIIKVPPNTTIYTYMVCYLLYSNKNRCLDNGKFAR